MRKCRFNIRHKLKKFTALSSLEKKKFLEAWLVLGIMRAAMWMTSFKQLTGSLKQQNGGSQAPSLSEQDEIIADTIGKAICTAANNTPWESACLVQSLTAQRMLQRRGISGVFYLGVRKHETGEEQMSAHAWTRCGNIIITGHQGHEEFTQVSAFEWGE